MLREVQRKTFVRNFRPESSSAALGENANITQQTKGKGSRKWARESSEITCHCHGRKHTPAGNSLMSKPSTAQDPFAALCHYLKVGYLQLQLLQGRTKSLFWFLSWHVTCMFIVWTFGITPRETMALSQKQWSLGVALLLSTACRAAKDSDKIFQESL